MIGHRQALKLLVVVTFAFAVVTIVRNIECVILLPSNHAPRIFTLREVEEQPIFIGKSFDTGACVVPTSFINDSQGCKVPNVDPYNDYIKKALNPVRSISCRGRLYTEYQNNLFRLLDDVNEGLLDRFLLCNFEKSKTSQYTKRSKFTKRVLQTYFILLKPYFKHTSGYTESYTSNILHSILKVYLKHTSQCFKSIL